MTSYEQLFGSLLLLGGGTLIAVSIPFLWDRYLGDRTQFERNSYDAQEFNQNKLWRLLRKVAVISETMPKDRNFATVKDLIWAIGGVQEAVRIIDPHKVSPEEAMALLEAIGGVYQELLNNPQERYTLLRYWWVSHLMVKVGKRAEKMVIIGG